MVAYVIKTELKTVETPTTTNDVGEKQSSQLVRERFQ